MAKGSKKQQYVIKYDDSCELWLVDGLQELNDTLRENHEMGDSLDDIEVWKLGDKVKIKAEFILEIS